MLFAFRVALWNNLETFSISSNITEETKLNSSTSNVHNCVTASESVASYTMSLVASRSS